MDVQTIALIGMLGLGAIYAIIIYNILHNMFNYVFWGDGFSKHLLGIFVGGALFAGLTLVLWKIVAVVVGIAGVIFALSQKEKEKKILVVVLNVVFIGVIAFFGSAFIAAQ